MVVLIAGGHAVVDVLFYDAFEFDPVEDPIANVRLPLRKMFVAEERHLAGLIVNALSDGDYAINVVTLVARLVLATAAAEEHFGTGALLADGTHGFLILLGEDPLKAKANVVGMGLAIKRFLDPPELWNEKGAPKVDVLSVAILYES